MTVWAVSDGRLERVDRDPDEPGTGQILVRVSCCGVCRTDLHLLDGDLPPRGQLVVPGHEVVGRVAADFESAVGKIVETGEAKALARNPKHPYTEALFSAALPSHPDERREEIILPGEVPSPINPPSGCRFHPRCPQAMPRCSSDVPELRDIGGRIVSCHLYDEPAAGRAPLRVAAAAGAD